MAAKRSGVKSLGWGFLTLLIGARFALAETIEMVTYYPSSTAQSQNSDLHVRSLTVGTGYANQNPSDGLALVQTQMGIGTTKPGDMLQVQGTGHTYVAIGSSGANNLDRGIRFLSQSLGNAGYLTVVPNTVGTSSVMNFYVGGKASPDLKLSITDDGNVGIGTTAPGYRLDVRGTSNFADTMYLGGGTQGTISWGTMGGGNGFGIMASSGRNLSLGSGGAWDKLVINGATGNVGIGTAAPQARLDVVGEGSALIVPRKSASTEDLSGPVNGMIYYNDKKGKFRIYENKEWKDVSGGTLGPPAYDSGWRTITGAAVGIPYFEDTHGLGTWETFVYLERQMPDGTIVEGTQSYYIDGTSKYAWWEKTENEITVFADFLGNGNTMKIRVKIWKAE